MTRICMIKQCDQTSETERGHGMEWMVTADQRDREGDRQMEG